MPLNIHNDFLAAAPTKSGTYVCRASDKKKKEKDVLYIASDARGRAHGRVRGRACMRVRVYASVHAGVCAGVYAGAGTRV